MLLQFLASLRRDVDPCRADVSRNLFANGHDTLLPLDGRTRRAAAQPRSMRYRFVPQASMRGLENPEVVPRRSPGRRSPMAVRRRFWTEALTPSAPAPPAQLPHSTLTGSVARFAASPYNVGTWQLSTISAFPASGGRYRLSIARRLP